MAYNYYPPQHLTKQPSMMLLEESLMYILTKTKNEPFSMAKLEKFLYFCDFDFYEKHEKHLFGLEYRKNFSGMCEGLPKALASMSARKHIVERSLLFCDYFAMKWEPKSEPKLDVIGAEFLEHIDWEIERLSQKMSSSDLNNLLFTDIPWMASDIGEVLDYEMVFYRDTEHAVSES